MHSLSSYGSNTVEREVKVFKLPNQLVAQLDVPSDRRPGGCGFNPRRGWQHSFMETGHEIFSMVILTLPLVQEGQLSVSGERLCTILVNCSEDIACPVNLWLGKLTALDHWVDWVIKPQHKQTKSVISSASNHVRHY